MTRHRCIEVILRAVFDHTRVRSAPGLVWHTPNGGKRMALKPAIFTGLGIRHSDVSDVIAVQNGRIFGLEHEAEDGRLAEAPLQPIAAVEAAGTFICAAHGLNRALIVVVSWHVLRRHAS